MDNTQAILPPGNGGYREEPLLVKTNPGMVFNTESIPGQESWEEKSYIDKFQLTQLLGKGGMGSVYQAQSPANESVAIKLIDAEKHSGPRLLDRVIDEYELLSMVDHPHVIQVHDHGFTDTHIYIVMGLLTNESLHTKILKGLSVEDTIKISIDICHALATIHDLGILHRDIKPTNILFDENNRPVLTDFGIAKIAGRPYNMDFTPHGKTLGTPAYMSPEQALGEELTAKTDLYAFGVMMYQMLTGQLLFKANTPIGMMKQQVKATPPHLPHDLIDFDPIVQRLLHKQAELRYESAWELHSDLEKFIM